MMEKEFEVNDLGTLKHFLGMEIARCKKGISISQRKYTLDLLKEMGILGCKPNNTLIELGNKGRMFKGGPMDKERYQHLVRKPIYLFNTRPNIIVTSSSRGNSLLQCKVKLRTIDLIWFDSFPRSRVGRSFVHRGAPFIVAQTFLLQEV